MSGLHPACSGSISNHHDLSHDAQQQVHLAIRRRLDIIELFVLTSTIRMLATPLERKT